jgi:excisionase family DNA binding protein
MNLEPALENWRQMTVLTAEEVAKILGVSRSTVYELLRCGEIRSLPIGTIRRVTPSALAEFLEGRNGALNGAQER